MSILNQLMEKKDLDIYINLRIDFLNSTKTAEIMSRPEKERGLIQERFNGRIRELKKLKSLLSQDKIKDMDKEYFRFVNKDEKGWIEYENNYLKDDPPDSIID